MVNKALSFTIISVVFTLLMTTKIMANQVSNPIKNSLAITNKYMPQAYGTMWQSEHLVWRAQLFKSACESHNPSLRYAINSGFPLVTQFINDQALINGDFENKLNSTALTTEITASLLHDTNKLYYRIFSDIFSYAYIRRLQVVQHFHPEVRLDLCKHAKKLASEQPIDEVAISPWKTKKSSVFKPWPADMSSISILSKYFSAAYIARQQSFTGIIDAKIYAFKQGNKSAVSEFRTLTNSYEYSSLLLKKFNEAYQDDNGKALPERYWRAEYATQASVWADSSYTLATLSALQQISELYPELDGKIEAHMASYIDLQLSDLPAKKRQLDTALAQAVAELTPI